MKFKKFDSTPKRSSRPLGATLRAVCSFAWLAGAAVCPAEPLVRVFKQDAVEVNVRIDPPAADPAKNTEVVVELAHPDSVAVTLPDDLAGRFEGFALEGSYVAESAQAGAATRRAHHFNLRPVPGAARHRIRPFAVRVKDASSHPPRESWFATEMIAIPAATAQETAPATVETALEPRYIRPSLRGISRIALIALGAVLAAALLWTLGSRIAFARKIRRMTPRERALRELAMLLDRGLPEQGLFKDFYIELTLVVRRYIERRHGIRAPEQTTEEFLTAAAAHPGFRAEAVLGLKAFLTAADLVKFAGVMATVGMAAEATTKAKAYLEGEAEAAEATAQAKEVAP